MSRLWGRTTAWFWSTPSGTRNATGLARTRAARACPEISSRRAMPVRQGHPLVHDNASQIQRCTDQRADTLGSPGRGEGELDLGALDPSTPSIACYTSSSLLALPHWAVWRGRFVVTPIQTSPRRAAGPILGSAVCRFSQMGMPIWDMRELREPTDSAARASTRVNEIVPFPHGCALSAGCSLLSCRSSYLAPDELAPAGESALVYRLPEVSCRCERNGSRGGDSHHRLGLRTEVTSAQYGMLRWSGALAM